MFYTKGSERDWGLFIILQTFSNLCLYFVSGKKATELWRICQPNAALGAKLIITLPPPHITLLTIVLYDTYGGIKIIHIRDKNKLLFGAVHLAWDAVKDEQSNWHCDENEFSTYSKRISIYAHYVNISFALFQNLLK